eukprot:364552-Chlamydomonas_euryale.AAC.5
MHANVPEPDACSGRHPMHANMQIPDACNRPAHYACAGTKRMQPCQHPTHATESATDAFECASTPHVHRHADMPAPDACKCACCMHEKQQRLRVWTHARFVASTSVLMVSSVFCGCVQRDGHSCKTATLRSARFQFAGKRISVERAAASPVPCSLPSPSWSHRRCGAFAAIPIIGAHCPARNGQCQHHRR